ncbi:TraR/DksA C4-type zinc finger protein [Pseudomonas sp. R5(2019)]|uniref:TraR/DksA C4-type zinc finger protein n=1 Tax=Pseudomonas sp. R5(2019) TaxID=2697566 RepID=UPI00141242E2|nr:TraR/DksA C4-type zinc finger protein [Pseudomonas sp. R5(2019)]NBA97967.1 TraR/DksA family transcriptional regulator [Pseudomonas sp. R5(2019)]
MTDWLDRAKAIEELERERVIEAQRAQLRPAGPSRVLCLDCDELIPQERQALGGMTRCVPCQTLAEAGQRR